MLCWIAGRDTLNTLFFYLRLRFSNNSPFPKLSNSFQFYKQTDGFGKLHWHFSHSHSCGQNRTMRVYHYPAILGRGKATFPTVALGSLRGSLASPYGKGHGVQFPWLSGITNVSVCFIQLSKNNGESPERLPCIKGRRDRKEGRVSNRVPLSTFIPLLVLTQYQNPTSF